MPMRMHGWYAQIDKWLSLHATNYCRPKIGSIQPCGGRENVAVQTRARSGAAVFGEVAPITGSEARDS